MVAFGSLVIPHWCVCNVQHGRGQAFGPRVATRDPSGIEKQHPS